MYSVLYIPALYFDWMPPLHPDCVTVLVSSTTQLKLNVTVLELFSHTALLFPHASHPHEVRPDGRAEGRGRGPEQPDGGVAAAGRAAKERPPDRGGQANAASARIGMKS